ncbi:SufE family protein [Pseudoalteromonas denitrificans]|uniref:Cysteine desulfuration protein SufE n=1 Tax=Pseudoalteromonas denitrificans DSM 6059 TaxID=1123010 RepID=A0A1I1GB83_9GAMM|nr:SufE family protein [Pseudoalteromonas denitrificans]SFC08977.1 Cysteine desulfuration protein SufE [Pseudoalteromonas denitrificans DSM 6059]
MNDTYINIKNKISNANTWQEKYREIMLLGKTLPQLSNELKIDSALVDGCESKVWLHLEFKIGLQENTLFINANSDTRIVKGLLCIIINLYSDLTPSEILSINPEKEFEDMSLLKHLSPSRGNGIKAILSVIHNKATAQK